MTDMLSNPATVVFAVPIAAIIAYFWHETCKARSNNELKQSMVERGMSAQEIEQVVNAGIKPTKKK